MSDIAGSDEDLERIVDLVKAIHSSRIIGFPDLGRAKVRVLLLPEDSIHKASDATITDRDTVAD